MSVPDAAVKFLINNLAQIVIYNHDLIVHVKEKIDSLSHNLVELTALMSEFEKYDDDSDYVKVTVKKMRAVIGRAEDAVETYILQLAVKSSRSWIENFYNELIQPTVFFDMANQINALADEIKEINDKNAQRCLQVMQQQAVNNINLPSRSKEAPKVEEGHVIGFGKAAEEVEKLLTGSPEQLEIVSIVGMLGLGKTTLARKVYNDPDVDYEFMIKAFVYVSKDFDRKDVFLQILRSFTQTDALKDKTAEELEKHLHQELVGKQYLIVLDDVWEKKDWDDFRLAFPNNEKRCRVLITTRNKKVAEYANPKVTPYMLDFLSLDESRELLRWRVFGENSCPYEVLAYEIEIANKCDGLPLAIVVIAGIIWNHREKISWWRDVADSVKDYIAKNQEETTKVIDLMYKHLPNYLKPCFLYLGVFREDDKIHVWKLVRLWIAEGFIQPEGKECLEDLAEVYLDELVDRNLVMVGERSPNGKIKTLRMHDTLREFCKKEAVEENLFHEVKRGKTSFSLSGNSPSDPRRLCLNNANIIDYMSQNLHGKGIRSFLTFVKEEATVGPKLVTCLPKTFKLLRVLEVESLKFTRFPVDLRNLVLLKYIAISSNFESVPQALSSLIFMQTLIVQTTSPTLKVNADIWKMPQFRHLHTNASTILPCPKPLEKKTEVEALPGEDIQTLSTIAPESCTKEVFDGTRNLKKLGIKGNLTEVIKATGESSLFEYLCGLESFENLKLLNDEVDSKLHRLPPSRNFPKMLKKLTLMGTFLNWDEMSTLGELVNLEILRLKDFAFEGVHWPTQKGGFRRLIHLYIGRMNLMVWEGASVEHFPVLRSLELNGCEKLNGVPRGLGEISSFQSLVLHCTNVNVASSAKSLELLKLKQAGKGKKGNNFNLSIYPPDHNVVN